MAFPKPKYENSAGRLLAFLNALVGGKAVLEVIPPIFGTGGNTKEEKQQATVEALGQIHALYVEFLDDMSTAAANDNQRNVLFAGLTGIRASIYPANLEGAPRVATDAEKSLMEMAATIIPEEPLLDNADVEAIKQSIEALGVLIQDEKTSATVKKVLREMIRLSEEAVSRYNIFGARGLRKAFKAMLAEAFEAFGLEPDKERREEAKKSPAWDKIVKHLRIIDAVSAKLRKHLPLLGQASRWLLDGPDDSSSHE